MIRGPQGPRTPYSSQPNREFARAPTRIFVWRQSLRVGVRADGTDPYGKSEPLQGARGGPHRRRVPAAQRSRRREALPRRGRRRHSRRGRRGLPARPGVPGMRRPRRLEGRVHRGRGPGGDNPVGRRLCQEAHGTLRAAGKRPCVANVAVARELACWVWELGCRAEGTMA